MMADRGRQCTQGGQVTVACYRFALTLGPPVLSARFPPEHSREGGRQGGMDLEINERMPDSREFQTCGETDGQTEH